jgi:dihydrofolate synthase/folylpolyglutamate synthase
VTAEQSAEVRGVIQGRADDCDVELCVAAGSVTEHEKFATGRFIVTFETTDGIYDRVRLALRGRHQIRNALLAINIAETLAKQNPGITESAIKRGLEEAVHPGRLELVTPDDDTAPILFDGAHNPEGAASLAGFLKEFAPQPLTIVFGAMSDKDLARITSLLFPLASQLVLTCVDNPRAASLETLSHFVHDNPATAVTYAESALIALETARRITPPTA